MPEVMQKNKLQSRLRGLIGADGDDITHKQCYTSLFLGRLRGRARLRAETEQSEREKMKMLMRTGKPMKRQEMARWKHAKALHNCL